MTAHALQTLLERYLDGNDDCQIQSYSGRAMYGAQCLAISEPLPKIISGLVEGCLEEGADLTPAERCEIRDAVAGLRTDELGRGMVVYFPGVPYTARCDFDECEETASERRGPMTYCETHAFEHDVLNDGDAT